MHRFSGRDGSKPAGLAWSGSMLYGATMNGGSWQGGVLFEVGAGGAGYQVLHNFTCSVGGAFPWPGRGLTRLESVLYGTTGAGGADNCGVIFRVNADGTGFRVLKELTAAEGAHPYESLLLAGDTLFGTASAGGIPIPIAGGCVFKVKTDGSGFTILKRFLGGADGLFPQGGLVLVDNTLYGTTFAGGIHSAGTLFQIDTDGRGYAVLKHFGWADGSMPYAALTLAPDPGASGAPGTNRVRPRFTTHATLYGTTWSGGDFDLGTVFKIGNDGSGFRVLRHFQGADGSHPYAGVLLLGGTLYGTAESGGDAGFGTLFRLDTDGTGFQVLKQFTGSDGANPQSGLVIRNTDSGGLVLYGTAFNNDGYDDGLVFSLALPPTLPPAAPLIQVVRALDGGIDIRVSCAGGATCQLWGSENLVDWFPIAGGVADPDGTLLFEDAPSLPSCFYRAELLP